MGTSTTRAVSKTGESDISSIDNSAYPTGEEIADVVEIFENLRSNSRMKDAKAECIKKILQSDNSWKNVVADLLEEFIPKKRTKKDDSGADEPTLGYQCRICLVPLKGHVCPYCEVCSNSMNKHGGGHACFNCSTCFYEAKKKKKLLQVRKGSCKCKIEQI